MGFKNKASARKIINVDDEGNALPTDLLDHVVGNWDAISEIRICRKRGRQGYVTLTTTRRITDAEIGLMSLGPEDQSTAESLTAEAYQAARSDAESEGRPLSYRFEGMEDLGDRKRAQLFQVVIKIDPVEIPGHDSDDSPTAAIVDAATRAVERFAAIADRSMTQTLAHHEVLSKQLSDERARMTEYAVFLRDQDHTQLIQADQFMRHQEESQRQDAIAAMMMKAMEDITPGITAWIASKGAQKMSKSDEATPKKDAGDPTPCEEAGALDRVITRLEAETLSTFRAGQGDAWPIWERARIATDRAAFDSEVTAILLHHDAGEPMQAMGLAQKWGDQLGKDAQAGMLPILMGFHGRVSWPLTLPEDREAKG